MRIRQLSTVPSTISWIPKKKRSYPVFPDFSVEQSLSIFSIHIERWKHWFSLSILNTKYLGVFANGGSVACRLRSSATKLYCKFALYAKHCITFSWEVYLVGSMPAAAGTEVLRRQRMRINSQVEKCSLLAEKALKEAKHRREYILEGKLATHSGVFGIQYSICWDIDIEKVLRILTKVSQYQMHDCLPSSTTCCQFP